MGKSGQQPVRYVDAPGPNLYVQVNTLLTFYCSFIDVHRRDPIYPFRPDILCQSTNLNSPVFLANNLAMYSPSGQRPLPDSMGRTIIHQRVGGDQGRAEGDRVFW